MNKKTKKIISIIGATAIMTGAFSYITPTIINNEKYVDSDDRNLSNNDYLFATDSIIFDNDFNKKVFYVQKNEKEEFLSLNSNVKGYTCLGVYSSMSSADAVLYKVSNVNNKVEFKVLSYDDLENNKLNDNEKIYVIDDAAPSYVKENTFIPSDSIKQIGSAKVLK